MPSRFVAVAVNTLFHRRARLIQAVCRRVEGVVANCVGTCNTLLWYWISPVEAGGKRQQASKGERNHIKTDSVTQSVHIGSPTTLPRLVHGKKLVRWQGERGYLLDSRSLGKRQSYKPFLTVALLTGSLDEPSSFTRLAIRSS